MQVDVRKAEVSDAEYIVRIVDSVSIKVVKDKTKGFLGINRGKEGYSEYIRKSNYCYVALVDDKIVGFVIAFPNDMLKPDYSVHKYICNKYLGKKFIYIFQIAVIPVMQGNGIGEKMYEILFKDTAGMKKIVVSSAKPYNKASEDFHLRTGFKKVCVIEREDGLSFLYEREG